jgi:hypothetical protein
MAGCGASIDAQHFLEGLPQHLGEKPIQAVSAI